VNEDIRFEIGDGFKFLVIAFVSLRIPVNLLQYAPGPSDHRGLAQLADGIWLMEQKMKRDFLSGFLEFVEGLK
jgi:hypothetical protein